MSKVQQERGFRSLPSSIETNPNDHVKSISTTVEADESFIRRIRSSQYAVSTRQNSTLMYEIRQMTIPFLSRLNDYYYEEKKESYGPQFSEAYSYGASHIGNLLPRKEKDPESFTLPCYINTVCFENALADLGASVSVMPLSTYLNLGLDFIILDMPEVPLILRRPFLSTTHAKIDVFKRKITLRVGEEKIIFKSVKLASSLIRRVYMLSLRERMELDLEARLMGETLVLNRSLNPLDGDYIELNDLNEPIELRRNQVDDLEPTIEEGEVIDAPMDDLVKTRNNDLDTGINDYPSFEFIHVNFFPMLYVNMMSKKFYNSIMKDNLEYKGNNVLGSLMSMSIFVGTFSIVTYFTVFEDMDAYHDEGMGDVIFSEPFLREICIKARWFKGIITIYNGNDEVTYQMARSHLRFKHLTNVQCNKIPPLLKVSAQDKLNGISHPYQKIKSFNKGVLNLGPEYIRDSKMEEWLTRGHISVDEMK
ncbi:hypothetical protein Tco_1000930 [Tanacetum coccineum]